MTGKSDPSDDLPLTQSLMRDGERLSSENEEKTETDQIPSDTLRRAPHIVFLTLAYAAVVLFAWAVLCILAHRPIEARSYTIDFESETGMEKYYAGKMGAFTQSKRILRAAQVFRSAATVLTIPLTSVVCSYAAVVFLQRQRKQSWWNPTLRQSMALADKSWNDPVLITKLIAGGWRRYGSLFLLFAIVLNLVGASIAPLQGLFVSYKSIKVPTKPSSMQDLIDLKHHLEYYGYMDNKGESTTQLRSRLMSTSNREPQFRLWSSEPGCGNSSNKSSQVCTTAGQPTFGIMPNLSDPFWAQPPADFQTGLWQQFATRVNFTSKYEKMTTDAFPSDCGQKPGALYLHYENTTDNGGYIVDICMPGDQAHSPWKATHARQDFSEELYVKMNLTWDVAMDLDSIAFHPGNYAFKLTLNTTAGYFELPNYQNGQLPGPLLQDGPNTSCGDGCSYQNLESHKRKRYLLDPRKDETEEAVANVTSSLSKVSKGPLLSTTLALFGAGSYLDINHTVAEAYQAGSTDEWPGCIDVIPFVKLLRGPDNKLVSTSLDPCVKGADAKLRQQIVVASYIALFGADAVRGQFNVEPPSPKRIQDAFAAAAFLAVDEWIEEAKMENPIEATLSWDMGIDQQVPYIPGGGMVLISALLGIYLVCMLGLSLYSAWTPRWTNQLDAFAMMRISAAVPGRFPLRLAHSPGEVDDLDKLSGWIGGTTNVEGGGVDCVGELGLGGEIPLEEKKRYHSYATG